MKENCGIIRDLMPLYFDGIASDQSRKMVEEHLPECRECSEIFTRMKDDEAAHTVIAERSDIIAKQKKVFERKSAIIGCVLSGIFMIPILVCLIVNLAVGSGLTWFFIVLASLLVAASLTAVPMIAPSNKGLWTLGTFCATVILLFGVCCLYTGGRWFFTATASTVFGLAVVFLPLVVRSRPIAEFFGNKKGLAVMTADTVLYALMMCAIGRFVNVPDYAVICAAISTPLLIFAWAIFAVIRYVGTNAWQKAGVCIAFCGIFEFFADAIINLILGSRVHLPVFSPAVWNTGTVDGNIKWLTMIAGVAAGIVLTTIGIAKWRKKK